MMDYNKIMMFLGHPSVACTLLFVLLITSYEIGKYGWIRLWMIAVIFVFGWTLVAFEHYTENKGWQRE